MDPLVVAAQFAAFCQAIEDRTDQASIESARTLARRQWPAFLDAVPEGLGKLLLRIGRCKSRSRRATPQRRRTVVRRTASLQAAG